MKINDPNIITDLLIRITKESLAASTSVLKMRIKSNKLQCPWYNWKVLNAIDRKQKLLKRIKHAKKIKNKLRGLLKIESKRLRKT
jgi:hypothetical protein